MDALVTSAKTVCDLTHHTYTTMDNKNLKSVTHTRIQSPFTSIVKLKCTAADWLQTSLNYSVHVYVISSQYKYSSVRASEVSYRTLVI